MSFLPAVSTAFCISDLTSSVELRWLVLLLENNRARLILATVASSTMFLWDYILTFRMEVELVWASKWNFMKGLYLLQRYLPFFDTVFLVLYRQFRYLIYLLVLILGRSNWVKFIASWVSEGVLGQWRFVGPCLERRRRGIISFAVMMVTGFASSESKFDFRPLL